MTLQDRFAVLVRDFLNEELDETRIVTKAMPKGNLYERAMAMVEKPLVEGTIERLCGRKQRAAKALGINRNTLLRIIRGRG